MLSLRMYVPECTAVSFMLLITTLVELYHAPSGCLVMVDHTTKYFTSGFENSNGANDFQVYVRTYLST